MSIDGSGLVVLLVAMVAVVAAWIAAMIDTPEENNRKQTTV